MKIWANPAEEQGPTAATAWAILAACGPGILVIAMCLASRVGFVPLLRFAVLSFTISAFGTCFVLYRKCLSNVQSLAEVTRRLHKFAMLLNETEYRATLINLSNDLESELATERNTYRHYGCWTCVSLAMMIFVASNFVYLTNERHSRLEQLEEAITAESGLGEDVGQKEVSGEVGRLAGLTYYDFATASVAMAALGLAASKLYCFHARRGRMREATKKIPIDLFAV